MSTALAVRMMCEPVRTIGFAAISPAYMGIGTAMSRPIRIFMLQNLTDVPLWYSFNGINDHFPLAANGYILLDITANKTLAHGFFLAEGQRLYVRQYNVAPTQDATHLTTFYGADV